jgi:hypothetical protein
VSAGFESVVKLQPAAIRSSKPSGFARRFTRFIHAIVKDSRASAMGNATADRSYICTLTRRIEPAYTPRARVALRAHNAIAERKIKQATKSNAALAHHGCANNRAQHD